MDAPSKSRAVAGASVVAIVVLVLAGTVPAIEAAERQQSQPETDNTVTRIEVHADGSAHWTIRIRTRLDTAERVSEYEAFQEGFRANTSSYLDPFRTRMTGVVANAANTTGRDMQARNFAASTSIQEVPRRWGVVTYEFTWTRFARGTEEGFVVGDVFEGGFFLAENDTLEIAASGGFDVEEVEPTPDAREAGVVTWQGRETFADGRPRVALQRNTSTPGGETSSPGLGLSTWLAMLVIGALLVAGIYYGDQYRRDGGAGGYGGGPPSGDGPDGSTGGNAATVDSETAADGTAAGGTAGTGTAAGGTANGSRADSPAAGEAAAEPTAPADDPVMTDEERVVALLESREGRMRQAAIAEELDWSASKTSRTIGAMAEDGTVEKLQLGRENLVALGDDEDS